jgi:hypothetical protein
LKYRGEENREEKSYVLTLTVAAKCFSNGYKEILPSSLLAMRQQRNSMVG